MRPLPPVLLEALERQGRGLTVLAVRLGAMGDILRTLPAVRALRARLPQARIYWVLEQPWQVLLDGHADLDGLVPLPRKEWDRMLRWPVRWPALLGGLAVYRARLRAIRPLVALDFHGNLRSGLTSRLSGASVRLGYSGHQQKEGNRLFTTHRVAAGSRRAPRVERNLDLVRALGVAETTTRDCALTLPHAGRAAAERVLSTLPEPGRPLVVVAPGSSLRQAYTRPPAHLLGAAARRAGARGAAALVVYGPGEEDDARRVVDSAPGAVLAPPTDLAALAALLARARLFVGGDSGPMHLACAVGCPVVALYGPTDPQVNQPWGVEYRCVYPPGRRYTGIKHIDRASGGFEGLEPELVVDAIDRLLEQAGG